MERCIYCGASVPRNAQFCGVCGNVPNARGEGPTSLSDYPGLNNAVDIEDTPTIMTRPVYPEQFGEEEDDVTIRNSGFGRTTAPSSSPGNSGGMNPITDPNAAGEMVFHTLAVTPLDTREDEEEEERRRALLLGLPLLGLAAKIGRASC